MHLDFNQSNAVSWIPLPSDTDTMLLAGSPLPGLSIPWPCCSVPWPTGAPAVRSKDKWRSSSQTWKEILYDQQSGDNLQDVSTWCCSMGLSFDGMLPTAYTPVSIMAPREQLPDVLGVCCWQTSCSPYDQGGRVPGWVPLLSSRVFIRAVTNCRMDISSSQSLLKAEQPQLSQPFLMTEVLQAPHHLCHPPLDYLTYIWINTLHLALLSKTGPTRR